RFGLTDRVAKFIADGADIAQRDIFGFDALRWSVVRDYRAAFDLIIAAAGTPDFCAALKAAVEYERVEPAALLAQRCTSPEKRLELFKSAVALGSAGIAKPLIDTEPALHLTESYLRAALDKAVSAGSVEIARLLLDHASVERWETLRQDLMSTAARRQNTGMIGLLLERGADAGPALRLAVQWKAYENVRTLAGLGVDLNKAPPVQPQKKRTVDVQFDPLGHQLPGPDADPPIFMALHPLMDFKMVDLLLELGASPNVRDASGRTPLMIAITHSQ